MRVCNEACKVRRNSTLYEMKKNFRPTVQKIILVLLYSKNLFQGRFRKDISEINGGNVAGQKAREMTTTRGSYIALCRCHFANLSEHIFEIKLTK